MKDKFTIQDVEKLGRLAHLSLSDEEKSRLVSELSEIIGYVAQLERVDVGGIQPMSHVHGSTNVFRADVAEPSMDVQGFLQNVPDKSGRFIRVPIIVE